MEMQCFQHFDSGKWLWCDDKKIPLTSIFMYGPERFWCTESPISNQVGADHHRKRPVPYTWNFDKHIRQATVTKALDHVLSAGLQTQ